MERRPSVARALQLVDRPIFTTAEIAMLRDGSVSATAQVLKRMEQEGLLLRVRRGLWCLPRDPRFSPFSLVSFLAGPHRAYVSFLSALHLHGMIEQIPQIIYASTTAHTRTQHTPVGTYSFHRIDPQFFDGFHWYGQQQSFLVAEREKALVDCLYLSSRKGRRFGSFPEIEQGRPFSAHRAWGWVRQIRDTRIRRHVSERLNELLGAAGVAPSTEVG